MDALQIMETGEEVLDILFHLRPVHITKHVLANEIGDPIHFFHGDGLAGKGRARHRRRCLHPPDRCAAPETISAVGRQVVKNKRVLKVNGFN